MSKSPRTVTVLVTNDVFSLALPMLSRLAKICQAVQHSGSECWEITLSNPDWPAGEPGRSANVTCSYDTKDLKTSVTLELHLP